MASPMIREIEVKSVLTKSNLPVSDYSVNTYVGCTHACRYCYASFMKRFTGHPEPWGTFLDVKHWPKIRRPERYAGKELFIGSVTDPYLPQEEVFGRTRALLEQLAGSGVKLSIATKSDLVLRDLDLIKTFPDARVSWSVNTLDEGFKNDMDNAVAISKESEVEEIFQQQLDRCGVEYFDYYLLHNVNSMRYRQIIRKTHMFDYMKKWKENGRIKHIAFSFHDTADVLDQILTEHPEVEAVQIVVNYFDWNAYLVQSKACYDVIRKHGRQVIIMEPVKGGMLAKAPDDVQKLLQAEHPDWSPAAWALRFVGSLDGVLAVLSGMSTLGQVKENVAVMQDAQPLTKQDQDVLAQAARLYQKTGPVGTADFTPYEAVNPKGVSLAAILDTFNSCMLQPDPMFGAEHNYFSAEKAKHGLHKDDRCIPGEVILKNGANITELVRKAEDFLNEHSFFQYEF